MPQPELICLARRQDRGEGPLRPPARLPAAAKKAPAKKAPAKAKATKPAARKPRTTGQRTATATKPRRAARKPVAA